MDFIGKLRLFKWPQLAGATKFSELFAEMRNRYIVDAERFRPVIGRLQLAHFCCCEQSMPAKVCGFRFKHRGIIGIK